MRKLKDSLAKAKENVRLRLNRKLRERRGLSEFVSMLILVVIVVVVGGIMMGLFGDTIRQAWTTVSTRIMDLFNYS